MECLPWLTGPIIVVCSICLLIAGFVMGMWASTGRPDAGIGPDDIDLKYYPED